MEVKQVFLQDGRAVIEEVAVPKIDNKSVLVEVRCSSISSGTEASGMVSTGVPLYKRALKQPENVKLAFRMIKERGLTHTVRTVRGQLAAGHPTGYSAAGTVVEVGSLVNGFGKGDRVACAGAGIANHAEFIKVPVNLAVKVPDEVSDEQAATVTLGSIALQGVRRAELTLGETVLVVGLGFLGQLTCQFIRASGCNVIAVDPEPNRVDLAKEMGADHAFTDHDYRWTVAKITSSVGVDAAIITAASSSNELISMAMQASRRKGRVVVVGDVGLHLRREDFYAKELDFRISTSYGPGRYDPWYEYEGQDYPYAYVRWTENRNMSAYLRMIADGIINLDLLLEDPMPLEKAPELYEMLRQGNLGKLQKSFSYPTASRTLHTERILAPRPPKLGKRIEVALVGAGAFAQAIHLPNLAKMKGHYNLRRIVSRSGSTALTASRLYNVEFAGCDYLEAIRDRGVDLIFITTRHNLHGSQVLQALEAGKHVFVEKPLCLLPEELNEIEKFYQSDGSKPILFTGFNRRFSPPIRKLLSAIVDRTSPLMINYRMNVGFLSSEHWVHGLEGGGRNIGEACHIYDLFFYLTGARVADFSVQSIRSDGNYWRRNDNFSVSIQYTDGSVCSLIYTALGDTDTRLSKEQMDVFVDGKIYHLDDYKLLIEGPDKILWQNSVAKKGHEEELMNLSTCLNQGGDWPISLDTQISTTRLSFDIEDRIN